MSKAEKQNAPASQSGGGNLQGKAPNAPRRPVTPFMGKAGTPDNQSTNRGKGRS